MGFTRKFLKSMGIEDDKIDEIIEAHTEVTNALKTERDDYKTKADKLEEVEKELNTMKAAGDGGYKEKYEAEKTAHEALKQQITEEKNHANIEKAVRAYYESKNITDKNLNIAMRGTDLTKIELNDKGELKSTDALEELVKGDFASLVTITQTQGANTSNPPQNAGGKMSKEEIFKIKDATARQKAIAENIELFGNKGD